MEANVRDLEIDQSYRRPAHGPKVHLIQEWLGLNGFKVKIDDDFGPVTEQAVKDFQKWAGLSPTGIVDKETFAHLTRPIWAALNAIAGDKYTLGQLTVAYAQQHLRQHPMEIGGENRGPWVRLYMQDHEGPDWPWCAGFACFCLRQACTALNRPFPIEPSFSCDMLARSAMQRGLFVKGPANPSRITPGSFFLVRRKEGDWCHTGIVVDASSEAFHTIEGNTNDEGSREGYEVCARVRPYTNVDFIVI